MPNSPSISSATESILPTPQSVPREPVPRALLHDLKSPLNQIIGYSEMLIESVRDGETVFTLEPDLKRIRAAAGQLQNLLESNFVGEAGADFSAAPAPEIGAPNQNAEHQTQKHVDAPATTTPATTTPATTAPEMASEAGESALASGSAQGLLLVVDDNEANRDVLSRRLQRQNYSVETADSGAAALEKVRERTFDLVLLDIMMPEMDGYEVLRQLKADENLRPIPVIMISAIGEIESVVRCIEMGAEDYLPKPFNKTLLKARIGACLEKKRAHDREARLFAQLESNYARLQALEKMRDDLTNMIVHDLRTPLSSLLAGLQTMPMIAPLAAAQTECYDIAIRGGFTLLAMINDLLDIGKFESGTMQLEVQKINVRDLVEEARQQVLATAELMDITLKREVAPDLAPLPGDGEKLRRTLVNLLGNAVKFSFQKGTIAVGARAQDDEILFWVRDEGEGIPPAAFEQIFEKFGQVESRKAGRQMSTGLGLALCKMVVEAHGGRIWVESAVGQGSTFWFALPRA